MTADCALLHVQIVSVYNVRQWQNPWYIYDSESSVKPYHFAIGTRLGKYRRDELFLDHRRI